MGGLTWGPMDEVGCSKGPNVASHSLHQLLLQLCAVLCILHECDIRVDALPLHRMLIPAAHVGIDADIYVLTDYSVDGKQWWHHVECTTAPLLYRSAVASGICYMQLDSEDIWTLLHSACQVLTNAVKPARMTFHCVHSCPACQQAEQSQDGLQMHCAYNTSDVNWLIDSQMSQRKAAVPSVLTAHSLQLAAYDAELLGTKQLIEPNLSEGVFWHSPGAAAMQATKQEIKLLRHIKNLIPVMPKQGTTLIIVSKGRWVRGQMTHPTTAASAHCGWRPRALSISAVPILCPLTLITSSTRPVIQ